MRHRDGGDDAFDGERGREGDHPRAPRIGGSGFPSKEEENRRTPESEGDEEGEECRQSRPMKTPTILLQRTYSVLEGPAVACRSPYLRPFCRGIPPPRRK